MTLSDVSTRGMGSLAPFFVVSPRSAPTPNVSKPRIGPADPSPPIQSPGARAPATLSPAALVLAAVSFAAPAIADRTAAPEGAVAFTHEPTAVTPHHAGVDYLVTGQAWGDVDRDGCADLYLTDNVGPSTLLRNRCDGTFEPSPLAADVALPGAESGGAVFADYDNDGWLDLYVINRGANTLLRNRRGLGFDDVTSTAGVGDPGQGQTAAWGDFDNDGDLDLYVVNWFYFYQLNHPFNRDGLYRNEGDGTFTDISFLLDDVKLQYPGFSASFLDFDNDGDQDLYVVNDKHRGNPLWRNDGPGCGGWCFTDVSVATGAFRPAFAMGLAVGDYDGDLDLDLYYSSIAEAVFLENQTSQGSATFIERSLDAGVSPEATSWGTFFFDYDNDSWPDLYLATMNLEPEKSNRLYRNLGDGTFADVSAGCGADDNGLTYGTARADIDRDGHVDMVVGNRDAGYDVYRNLGAHGAANHWLRVILVGGGEVNRDGVGARVHLDLDNGRTLMQDLRTGSSHGAGNELALHFGLGTAQIRAIEVRWPDGLVQPVPVPAVDSELEVRHPRWADVFGDGFEGGDLLAWDRSFP
ncbi:MAG: FG-GAP-like repeat-containing protein [Acidobacteriota bacterium]